MQPIFRRARGVRPITTALFVLLAASAATNARADLYWDVNGAIPGASSGYGDAAGIWGSDNFWSTSPAGDVATIGWLDGQKAVFSAGSDVTNASVTLLGTQFLSGLSLEEGTVTLNSGWLHFRNEQAIINSAGDLRIYSPVLYADGLLKVGSGILTLSGNQAYVGPTVIDAGTLRLSGSLLDGGPVIVKGTLTGGARIYGQVTAMNGGHISPGNSLGSMTMNALTLDGAVLDIQEYSVPQVGGGFIVGFDSIRITDPDTFKLLGTSTINVSLDGTFFPGDRMIIDYAGAPLPNIDGLKLGTLAVGDYRLSLVHDTVNTQIKLRINPLGTPQWKVDRDGSWGAVGNWTTMYIPDGAIDDAFLYRYVTAHRTITLDGDRTVRSLRFYDAAGYTIAPGTGGKLTVLDSVAGLRGPNEILVPVILGGDASISAGGGPLAIKGGVTLPANHTLFVSAYWDQFYQAIVSIGGPQSYGVGTKLINQAGIVRLDSDTGVAASLDAPATANLAIELPQTSVGNYPYLTTLVLGSDQHIRDLTLGDVIVTGYRGVDLASAPQPGAFNALHIYSTDLAATKAAMWHDILRNRARPGDGIFDSGLKDGAAIGVAIVTDEHGDQNVLVRSTRVGDLNLDGVVSIADFMELAAHFGASGSATWQEGDLNYDQSVTIADFIDLAANFNSTYAGSAAPIDAGDYRMLNDFASSIGVDPAVIGSNVPEPGVLGAVAAALNLSRRRRSRYNPHKPQPLTVA